MANAFDDFTPSLVQDKTTKEERNKREAAAQAELDPTMLQLAKKHAPTIGGIVGGILGGLIPAPGTSIPARAVGSAVGSTLGGTTGGNLQRQAPLPNVVSRPEAYSSAELSEIESQSGLTPYDLKEGAFQGALDFGTNTALGTIGKYVAGPAIKKALGTRVNPEAKDAQELLQQYGGTLTRGQALESGPTPLIESILRGTVLGKGVFEQTRKGADQALDKAAADIVKKAGGDTERYTSGQAFQDAISKGEVGLDDLVNPMYRQLDEITKPKQSFNVGSLGNPKEEFAYPVDVTEIKKNAIGILSKKKEANSLDRGQTDILNRIASLPDKINFSTAQDLRSFLTKKSRDLDTPGQKNTLALGLTKMFSPQFEKAMSDSASSSGDKAAYELYRKANDLYREGTKDLSGRNNFIGKLVAGDPEDVGKAIASNGNVSQIIDAKRALSRAADLDKSISFAERWKDLQTGYLQSMLLKRGTLDSGGNVIGYKLIKDLEQPEIKDTMKQLLSPEQMKAVDSLIKASNLSQRNTGATLPLMGVLAQASAVTLIGSAAYQSGGIDPLKMGAAGVVLGGPKVIAKILTDPKRVNRLVEATGQYNSKAFKPGAVIAKLAADLKEWGVTPEDVETGGESPGSFDDFK